MFSILSPCLCVVAVRDGEATHMVGEGCTEGLIQHLKDVNCRLYGRLLRRTNKGPDPVIVTGGEVVGTTAPVHAIVSYAAGEAFSIDDCPVCDMA